MEIIVEKKIYERLIYSIRCLICKRKIIGNSKETSIYNYQTHMRTKHKNDKK